MARSPLPPFSCLFLRTFCVFTRVPGFWPIPPNTRWYSVERLMYIVFKQWPFLRRFQTCYANYLSCIFASLMNEILVQHVWIQIKDTKCLKACWTSIRVFSMPLPLQIRFRQWFAVSLFWGVAWECPGWHDTRTQEDLGGCHRIFSWASEEAPEVLDWLIG